MKKMQKIFNAIILLSFLVSCTSNSLSNNTEMPSATPVEKSVTVQTNTELTFNFIDTSEFVNCLTNGTYRCGAEFEPGNYYILSLYGAEALYDVCDSPNKFTLSEYRVIRKIQVKEGQYVKLGDALLIPEKNIDENNLKKYGIFLVGKDLPAGDYKIETLEKSYHNDDYNISITGINGAYQICTQSPDGALVSSTLLFEKQSYITLQNDQYITINNVRLSLVE